MLGTGRVNKVFSPTIFISKNMVTNMKHALTKTLFRHNSASVIQKWLRFKRVNTVKLPYADMRVQSKKKRGKVRITNFISAKRLPNAAGGQGAL